MLKYKLEYEIDDVRTTLAHREIILHKPFLKKIYEEWYNKFIYESKKLPSGILLEIGSGGGFLKEVFPQVITSDIQEIASCDKCLSAENLPYRKEELSGIFMINVFHHIPNPAAFLNEAKRTLKSGGKIIMVEPFQPEGGWTIPSSGPLSGANGALPWIFFERDATEFHKKFPQLKIESVTYHTPLRYLLSGGVSRKALVPLWTWSLFKGVESILTGITKQASMFQTIEVIKK
jgi:SAM-dependent methyltransferase